MGDVVVSIGTGEGENLDTLLASRPARLCLVEPNPRLASQLRLKTEEYDNVELFEIAVSGNRKRKSGVLTEYQWNKVSSTAQPKDLQNVFPGLMPLKQHYVRIVFIDSLIKTLGIESHNAATLMIEVPGEEAAIMKALVQSGNIQRFSSIILHAPVYSLFKATTTLEDVIPDLTRLGFDLVARDESEIDWVTLHLNKSNWFEHHRKKESELNVLKSKLALEVQQKEKQSKLTKTLQVKQEALTKQYEAQIKLASDRQAQIGELTQQCEAQTTLALDRQAQIDELTKQNEAQTTLASDRQAQIDELTKQYEAQIKLASDRQAQIGELTQQCEAQTTLALDRQAQIDELTKQNEAQTTLASDRQAQIDGLTKQNEAQTTLASDRQAQIDELIQENEAQTTLASDRQAQIDELTKQYEAQTTLASDRQAQIDELTNQQEKQAIVVINYVDEIARLKKSQEELEFTQALLSEELVRSEGQIDFIKDVFLPEKDI